MYKNFLKSTLAVLALALSALPAHAERACGVEAQVRIPSGEIFVANQHVTVMGVAGTLTPFYLPATPYGYVGYRTGTGISFGLGIGMSLMSQDNQDQAVAPVTLGSIGTPQNVRSWGLMLAPTLQANLMQMGAFDIDLAARFVWTMSNSHLQLADANKTEINTDEMTFGGNLGAVGSWWATNNFALGAEAGVAGNYLITTKLNNDTVSKLPSLYTLQTYFALTATYVF